MLLRAAGQIGKAAKVLGTLSRVMSALSIAALAGGIALFCRRLIKSETS
jgi:hypothetical protein